MNTPDLYTRGNTLQRRDIRNFCEEFSDELGQIPGRCLDIGSGPGDAAVDFILPKLNSKATLVCSDISEKMLNYAKEKYKDNPRLSFVQMNIETTELPKTMIGQFDHVTSLYCLHWCQNIRQVFENIYQLIRPGGGALLAFLCHSNIYDIYKMFAAMPQYQPYTEDVDLYIPVFHHDERRRETLKNLLKVVGFEIGHVSERETTYIFDTRDALDKCLRAINPFADKMPASLRQVYMKDLAREFARRQITFNKNNDNENEYSTLIRYNLFIGYLRKPETP